jgi:hypothetical protein
MKRSRQLPRAFWLIAGGVLVAVVLLLIIVVSAASSADKSRYDFVKDMLLPLVAPLLITPVTALLLPIVLFYWLPLSQNRQKAVVELLTSYHTEEMRTARNEAWEYFVSGLKALSKEDQIKRLSDYLLYRTEPETNRTTSPALHKSYQQLARVLDFFALVNAYLERGEADRDTVQSFLAYYYIWWHDEVLVPLRSAPGLSGNDKLKQIGKNTSIKTKPIWWDGLKALDELCK